MMNLSVPCLCAHTLQLCIQSVLLVFLSVAHNQNHNGAKRATGMYSRHSFISLVFADYVTLSRYPNGHSRSPLNRLLLFLHTFLCYRPLPQNILWQWISCPEYICLVSHAKLPVFSQTGVSLLLFAQPVCHTF